MGELEDGLWRLDGPRPAPRVVVSFGVHGNERAPIEAGLELAAMLGRAAKLGRVQRWTPSSCTILEWGSERPRR